MSESDTEPNPFPALEEYGLTVEADEESGVCYVDRAKLSQVLGDKGVLAMYDEAYGHGQTQFTRGPFPWDVELALQTVKWKLKRQQNATRN